MRFAIKLYLLGIIINIAVPFLLTHTQATQIWNELQELTYSGQYTSNNFGVAIGLDGDTAIVGAVDYNHSNSVFLLHDLDSSNWDRVTTLSVDDGGIVGSGTATYASFGLSVDISGNEAIIGDHGNDASGKDSGAVYTFARRPSAAFAQTDKLTASDAVADDWFGASVAISGRTAIVGARGRDDFGSYSGAAYLFHKNSSDEWNEIAKLTANDAAAGQLFGKMVDISGDTAIVGMGWQDNSTFIPARQGSAYVFRDNGFGTWTQIAKLTGTNSSAGDCFGCSVAITGDKVVVGAYLDDERGTDAGAAYIFQEDATGVWNQVAKLTAEDISPFDHLGWSVGIDDNNTMIVGAPLKDSAIIDAGAAYIFRANDSGRWNEFAKLIASDPGRGDRLGISVELDGRRALVGARHEAWFNDGSLYAYKVSPIPEPSTIVLMTFVSSLSLGTHRVRRADMRRLHAVQ